MIDLVLKSQTPSQVPSGTMLANSERDPIEELRRRKPGCAWTR